MITVSDDLLKRLKRDLVKKCPRTIEIIETATDGRGKGAGVIEIRTINHCLSIRLPKNPVRWLQLQKCGDAAIFEFENNNIHLHIVELKSKITIGEWEKAKDQALGAYLNSLAIKTLLEIAEFSSITLHIAYDEDAISAIGTTAPSSMKIGIGAKHTVGTPSAYTEWTSQAVNIPGIGVNIPLRFIVRDPSGNASAALR